MDTLPTYRIESEECIRCGACSSTAPQIFVIEDDGAHIARQPASPAEQVDADAAAANCPTGAIIKEG